MPTVKSHVKALGLYNFIRVLDELINGVGEGGRGYIRRGVYKRNKKEFRNDEIKRI